MSEPPEMQLRLARTLFVEWNAHVSALSPDRYPETTWEEGANKFLFLARRMLEEMREPTEMMFMRGGNTALSNRGKDHLNPRPGKRIGDLAARDAWREMIDTALGGR